MVEIPFRLVCPDDYLHRDLVDHYLQHPEQDSGFDVLGIQRLVGNLSSGVDGLVVTVFQESGQYRVILDDQALASAYHYLGKTSIPANVLSPDDLEVPAYVRRGVSVECQKAEDGTRL